MHLHRSAALPELHVRTVNGDGQRCGCGAPSALRTHTGSLHDGVTERDIFLCATCAMEAVEDYVVTTRQPRYGEAVTEEYR